MFSRFSAAVLSGLLALFLAGSARAELTVDITKGVEGNIPIAVVPFGQAALPGDNLGRIVAADLAGSGRFNVLPEAQLPERPAPPDPVNFPAWQSAGQESLVIGRVVPGQGGQFEAEFFLFDAIKGTVLHTQRLPFAASEARHTAHEIADIIYKLLTGDRGIFNTRVAYVTAAGSGDRREYRLEIADTDGRDAQTVISSREPLMSPAWSPDGKRMAYVSFEGGSSAVYVQNLASGERRKVSSTPGINGAPAWSPDGSRLALTLSKDGSPDIYVLDLGSGSFRRLTNDTSIETEPHWSPDGRSLVFTSDRGGSPQLYLVAADGGSPERLTFEGDYNARGVFSPDGRKLALIQGSGGRYRIALLDLASKDVRVLTDGPLDESPGFSPDGSMVLYAGKENGVGQLAAVSLDGKRRQTLKVQGRQVRQPAWSP
jgi:TolB protein